jgi:hypothetical protein
MKHELADQALPVRVTADKNLELTDKICMAPECKICLNSLLQASQPKLLKPSSLRLRE